MNFGITLIASFILFSSGLKGQSSLEYNLITQQEGLSDNQVTSLAQDKTGYLWIGTPSGLNRFDGHDFKIFRSDINNPNSLPNDFVTSVYVDRNNEVWIGNLNEALVKYNQTTGEFTRFDQVKGGINGILEDDSVLWIGLSKNGFCRFNPKSHKAKVYSLKPFINKAYTEQDRNNYNTVNVLIKDKQGIIWLGTNDGLYSFSPATQQLNRHSLFLDEQVAFLDMPGASRDDLVNAMVYDANRNYIYIPALNGIRIYNTVTHQLELHKYGSENSNFYLTKINGLQWRSNNEIWLNSTDKGLMTFNVEAKKFKEDVNTSSTVYPGLILKTRDNLWIGCGKGLVKVSEKRNPLDIHTIVMPHENLYLEDAYFDTLHQKKFFAQGFGSGLVVSDWNEKHFKIFRCKTVIPNDVCVVTKLFNIDDQYLLVMSRDFIQLFDKKKEAWIEIDSSGTTNSIRGYFSYVIRDKNNNIWIGSKNDGVRLYDHVKKKLTWFTTSDYSNSIGSNKIRGIVEDAWGRIWFATADKGIEIYDPKKKSFTNLNKLNFGICIPFNDFESIALAPDSTIWIGSATHGLFQIKLSEKVFSINPSNVSASVAIIAIDKQGLIWVQSAPGAWTVGYGESLLVFDPKNDLSNTFVPVSSQFPFYNLINHNGSPIVGGMNCYYSPTGIHDIFSRNTPTPAVINSLKIEGKEIAFNPTGGDLELPYNRNSILIEFSSIDFSDSPLKQYLFKLEGLETEWNKVSSFQKVATYSKLPAGNYVFKVKLMNSGLGADKEQGLIRIRIYPPFWKTTWFVSLSYLAIVALFYFIVSYLIHRGVKEESMKQKLSSAQLVALRTQMNPHFIFNSLNAIQGLIVRSDVVKATQFTAKFSKLIRKVIENSERQIIPLSEEIENLQLYLSIESIRFDGRFQYSIDVGEDILDFEIPSMVIQPIVENVIWQNLSQSETVEKIDIQFLLDNEKIYCVIRHNAESMMNAANLSLPEKAVALKLTASRLAMISSRSEIQENDLLDENGRVKEHIVKIVFDLKSMSTLKRFLNSSINANV